MADHSGIDWEDAFANADYIPEANTFLETWPQVAQAFRDQSSGELDLAYGSHDREKLDLFLPEAEPLGLAVFVHGGYWLRFDKSYWSHLAHGAVQRGWAVAMPSYILTPEGSIADMPKQLAAAIALAAQSVNGPIHLCGHSAGGHLVSRLMCEDSALSAELQARLKRVVSLSGLHDLRPLLNHSMNATLGLTEAQAAAESPALLNPLPNKDFFAWVGAHERPEFLRQAALINEAWGLKGLSSQLIAEPQKHHFDVIDALTDPNSLLCHAFVGEV